MSPIPQMEGLDHRIHAGFGRHLAGALAFHLKSLSICDIGVICGFSSLFQVQFQLSSPPVGRDSVEPRHRNRDRDRSRLGPDPDGDSDPDFDEGSPPHPLSSV